MYRMCYFFIILYNYRNLKHLNIVHNFLVITGCMTDRGYTFKFPIVSQDRDHKHELLSNYPRCFLQKVSLVVRADAFCQEGLPVCCLYFLLLLLSGIYQPVCTDSAHIYLILENIQFKISYLLQSQNKVYRNLILITRFGFLFRF